jgi:uncharacterized protein (DUF488 family)
MIAKPPAVGRTIFTVGHSTRTVAELVALLKQVDVELLVDVRSIPRSRMVPQFNFDTLPNSLAQEGVLSVGDVTILKARRLRRTCSGAY